MTAWKFAGARWSLGVMALARMPRPALTFAAEAAASKFAEVTFTHDLGALNKQMDTRYANNPSLAGTIAIQILAFSLSDRDRFIQEHFFSGRGNLPTSWIRFIDEGVFIWKQGKTTALSLGRRAAPGLNAGG